MKINIFVEEINLLNSLFILILSFIGFKFYYLSLSNFLQKKKFISFLDRKNIELINFSKKKFNGNFFTGDIRNQARDELINKSKNICDKINFTNLSYFFSSIELLFSLLKL